MYLYLQEDGLFIIAICVDNILLAAKKRIFDSKTWENSITFLGFMSSKILRLEESGLDNTEAMLKNLC